MPSRLKMTMMRNMRTKMLPSCGSALPNVTTIWYSAGLFHTRVRTLD